MFHTTKQGGVPLDSKDRVVKQFQHSANSYLSSEIHAKGKDLVWLDELLADTSCEYALDIATGAGHTAFLLSKHAKLVVALDLTPAMIELASAETKKRNIPNMIAILGDAEHLPFTTETFDLITCRIAAHHFPHVDQAVTEMYRVLKKDGTLILIDNVVPNQPEDARLVNAIEKARDSSHHACLSLEEWNRLYQRAGFSQISVHREWITSQPIGEWLDRAQTSPENRQEIHRLISQLNNPEWADSSFIHLHKAMWICKK